jgi:FKBP12-rapamycin complex-associated protein
MEFRLLTKFHHKSESSLSMTKLEVFKHAMSNTVGSDINKVLWTKSQSAEDWLDRRTNYSRSLAVMSIVGYILGLGDRHPSNIMLDRISGKVIHIDFGDCFEVAMKRDKFPEKVPFRLTRMLIKALEIGGIEGTFRITCENVMRVVRENKDSLNVILAAFVHDPLTSFRLLIPLIMKNVKNKIKNEEINDKFREDNKLKENKIMNIIINKNKNNENKIEKKRMGSEERQLYNEFEEKDYIESDDLNRIIKIVLERVSDKLNGTDFKKNEELKISKQIRRIISQATSHENLSQSYLYWRTFW